ncbi:MAG: DUF2784 domain-containing protein [Candidatus Electryonea clarkiae]|nr:DUF2784 domain-containing protein [Candidatus Electryonea clarkiae]MDP8289244.1 DUF2784 domain-containing protein [Candidatus Electryonea clarkiae]
MSKSFDIYLLMADGILLIHFAFVTFIVAGFVFIWAGYFAKWRFIRNTKFRIAHIIAMAFVMGESLLGTICPLTNWENDLRIRGGQGKVYETTFMQEWIHRIIFYDFSEQTFTVLYAAFLLLILLTSWIIPPEFMLRSKHQDD